MLRTIENSLLLATRLDYLYYAMEEEPIRSKTQSLLLLAHILAEANVPYALIGGVAVQLWQREPRTTLDIDIAVRSYDTMPVLALEKAGFTKTGQFAHSQNWIGPDNVPVQFSADPFFEEAISEALERIIQGVPLRIAPSHLLVRAKLRAAGDEARRRSKRLQDLADAVALVESYPEIRDQLTDEECRMIDS